MEIYFILTLWCMTCQPVQSIELSGIPAYDGGSTQWADLICKAYGDVLSGDYERRNMKFGSEAGREAARKDWIVWTCVKESGEF